MIDPAKNQYYFTFFKENQEGEGTSVTNQDKRDSADTYSRPDPNTSKDTIQSNQYSNM